MMIHTVVDYGTLSSQDHSATANSVAGFGDPTR